MKTKLFYAESGATARSNWFLKKRELGERLDFLVSTDVLGGSIMGLTLSKCGFS